MAYGRYPKYRRRASVARRGKPLGTRKGAKRAVNRYKAKTFKRSVRSAVTGLVETKHLSHSFGTKIIYGNGLDNADTFPTASGVLFRNVMSNLELTRGFNSNNRIGNKINPTYIRVDGFVKTNAYDATTNQCTIPFDVKIIVFRYKPNADGYQGPQLPMVLVTDTPIQIQAPIDGSVEREMLPIAPEYTVLARRTLRLRPPVVGVAGDFSINSQTSNAPFYRRFRIYMKAPKTLSYPATAPDTPTNYWFSFGAYIVDASGIALPQNQQRATLIARATMGYKDA